MICDNDLLFLTETKLGDGDILDLPDNYCIKVKNRLKCVKKSGGIAVVFNRSQDVEYISTNSDSYEQTESEHYIKWNSDKVDDFVKKAENFPTQNILTFIDNSIASDVAVDNVINETVEQINNFFKDTAKTVFGTSRSRIINENKHNSKKWFTRDCCNKRKEFHHAKKLYDSSKTLYNKQNLKIKSKAYRRTLNFYYNKHKNYVSRKLSKMKRHNPRTFWSTLNRLTSNKRENVDVSLQSMYEHFRDLNSDIDDNNIHFVNTKAITDEFRNSVNKHKATPLFVKQNNAIKVSYDICSIQLKTIGKRAYMYHYPGCEVMIRGHNSTFCKRYTGVPTVADFTEDINEAVNQLKSDNADLIKRNLENGVNVMIFSDHGMTEVSQSHVINITGSIDMADVNVLLDRGATVNIWPKEGKVEKF
ncbi:hypothetical protein KUTeg_011152 [Tegillarca granosa]|uniref:Uncharacterized protein n=1 Tax=Tegillarca granosa TaxID=220873 RepID=A0ABQ9F1L9_TEGGR|nr:hypothetical protein KUTeg_011152 [Tegillarca granosa]